MSKPDLGAIITAFHDREIYGEVSWFYDSSWPVTPGDAKAGFASGCASGVGKDTPGNGDRMSRRSWPGTVRADSDLGRPTRQGA